MPARCGNQRKYFEFALWAAALGRPVPIKEIEGYFQISHQSAWRIHRNWMQANQTHRERSPAATGTRSNPFQRIVK